MRREGIRGVPAQPDWPDDLDAHWRDPRLLLSQTCGYPLVTRLAGVVQVVGAFRYTAPGCAGIHYRSELVVRSDEAGTRIDDFRGRVAACNDLQSHSGCNALRALVAPLAERGRYFTRTLESGSHRASLELLQSGQADIAAIDCITLAAFRRHRPALLAGLRTIGGTAPAPGLPLITAAATSAPVLAGLRRALSAACSEPALAGLRETLFIAGFEPVPASCWDSIEAMRRDAAALGCAAL